MHQVHYKPSGMARYQQGVTLIEVLVSMLLMAIIGLGAAYISGRTAVVHRDQNLHLHTVNQMRQYLEKGGCPSAAADGVSYVNAQNMKVAVECEVISKTFKIHSNGSNTNQEVVIQYPTLSVIEAASEADVADGQLVPAIPVKISP